MIVEKLKSPYPYFGGKSLVTDQVWQRFGNVYNYVEPFFGSGAVLLGRPHEPRCETINDKDCMVSNFWRATEMASDEVAFYCDRPVNEADLHAVHTWLLKQIKETDFVERMMTDPEFFNAKIAGRWCWGLGMWIGSGWCTDRATLKHPNLKRNNGGGVHRKRQILRRSGSGVHRQIPDLRGDSGAYGRGVHRCGLGPMQEYFRLLKDRMRRVRVCCGDWSRICGPSPTFKIGLTGVLLDPPYHESTGRDKELYKEEDLTISQKVREWAIEQGENKLMRIALCGLEGEHDMPASWDKVAWKGNGGYAKNKEERKLERIWYSPHCLKPEKLLI